MNVISKITSFNYKNNMGLVNMTGEFFALFIKELSKKENSSILVVTPNALEARTIYNKFLSDDVFLFEDDELVFGDETSISPETRVERLNTLNDLLGKKQRIGVTDLRGFLKKLPSVSDFKSEKLILSYKNSISRDKLIEKIMNFGYERNSFVEKMGDFSVRGFVVDIFPINSENPIRIEFFGDDIESIKEFDLNDQKTNKKLEKIEIIPFVESFSADNSSIYDYLDNPIVVFKDYDQLKVAYEKLALDSTEFEVDLNELYFGFNDINPNKKLFLLDFDSLISEKVSGIYDFASYSVPLFEEKTEEINNFVNKRISKGQTVIITLGIKNIEDFFAKTNFSYVLTDFDHIFENKVNVVREKLAEGFEKDEYVFLTELELFNRKSVTYRKTRFRNTSRIKDISKLEIGDYVVHSTHGIGIYNGMKMLKKGNIFADYLEVLYAKGDKLYIPASKIELISKYNGKDGYVPKINALNSTSWLNVKQRIREKIKIEAERLIKIQAEREVKQGFSFSKDSPMQEMFESEFSYDITPDQEKAIEEIKSDMESIKPMDRILCGDVGYGKTEVAFRAMFKAVLDGKQVFYLCPTTILCRQQYNVALDRFKNYPVNIGILSRFVTQKQITDTLKKLKNGEIDILFATHRGLSDDVEFKDLGLFVVDEEQRFGVVQKEKIKELKSSVDVLTLTATPIPRTLQMAVLGIRNLSLIETPPKNRKAVATYVTPFDKKLIREIVYKEVSRGGQVFILYNRVEDIERKVSMFKELLPDVTINFAHGKMDKSNFENVMNDFVLHKFDVLVCTTIIETGIDIPNVNSLIIMDADRFGLGQLYQIRGRVGRSDTLAYAYLMYEKGRVLTEKAIKRLKVIKEFNALGSGFSIAAKDLSIRGAGDILGSEQAGFIDSVGIDMYLKMLNEEIEKIKGTYVPEEDEDINLTIASHVKDDYVKEDDVKIEIHKLISTIKSEKDLKEVKKQLEDRFGKIDDDMKVYLQERLFEAIVKKIGIIDIFDNGIYREVTFSKEKSKNIKYDDLFIKSLNINNSFKFSYQRDQLLIRLKYIDAKGKHVVYDFNELFRELL